jgi:hypothetical protein
MRFVACKHSKPSSSLSSSSSAASSSCLSKKQFYCCSDSSTPTPPNLQTSLVLRRTGVIHDDLTRSAMHRGKQNSYSSARRRRRSEEGLGRSIRFSSFPNPGFRRRRQLIS